MGPEPGDAADRVVLVPDGQELACALFASAAFGLLQLDLEGRILAANPAAHRQLGFAPGELAGRPFADLLPPVERAAAAEALGALASGAKQAARLEVEYRRHDGSAGWSRLTGQLVAGGAGGGGLGTIVVLAEEATDRVQRARLESDERAVLERIARGGPLHDTLEAIAALVEGQSPGMLGSILLVDETGHVHVGAGHSLPAAYNEAVEGEPIGPAAGSCGTAAWRRETVVTPDIAHDPLWARYRAVALAAGLASSWSTPLFASDGRVIGTLAQYYRTPQDPTPRDLALIEVARHLAEIAIERAQAEAALRAARDDLERRVLERTAEMRANEARLRASERLLNEAQALAHMGSWEWDVASNEVRWSDELYRVYGLAPQAFGATFEAFLAQIREDDRPRVAEVVQRALERHEPYNIVEHIVRPTGEERTLSSSGRVEVDAEGRVARLWGICLDVTERAKAEEDLRRLYAELERRVEERTLQLEETNRELEAFSYSVSHDLRAPLRAIDGFSKILLEEHEQGLDEAGRGYLRRVRAASQRMDQLIDELLALSRLTRGALHVEDVDLSALAREVAAELRTAAADRDLGIAIADDLRAQGDPRLLRTVLENLLGNAVKFTARHAHAHILVGRMATDHGPAFFVRDDGAGFDMAYAEQLFKPFSRLHSQEEFAGSGIGLASVQRIVHRHGGRVWAEGQPERGATFFFTLGGTDR